MKSEFALAFNEVLEDKGLPREVILAALESAMVSAYRKTVGSSAAQDVQVEMDFDTGNVSVFVEKEVSDSITDYRTEVLLEDARKVHPDCEIGDLVMVESTPENFGRIAAQTARQAIQQRIRDAEKQRQYEHFIKQVGEITSGIVQAVNSRQATIGLDLKAEGTMQRKEMIQRGFPHSMTASALSWSVSKILPEVFRLNFHALTAIFYADCLRMKSLKFITALSRSAQLPANLVSVPKWQSRPRSRASTL